MIYTIIVTYNGEKWVEKCLGSLTNPSIQNKVIVIDNNSVDNTKKIIINNFPKVDLISLDNNLGFGNANNIGIKKAYDEDADYVFLLNQDAWVEKDTIEKLIKVASKNPDLGIISPMHLNGKGNALDYNFSNCLCPNYCPELYSDIYLNIIKDNLYETKFVNAAAWLLTRKCIETVGGFNPLFSMYGEDDNYIDRTQYHNLKIGIYPFSRIFHDREKRAESEYFIDNEKIFRRSILKKYCNPNEFSNITKESQLIYRQMIKSILKLDIRTFEIYRNRIKIINELLNDIIITKTASQNKGLTFLC